MFFSLLCTLYSLCPTYFSLLSFLPLLFSPSTLFYVIYFSQAENVNDKVTELKLKLSDLGCRSVIKMIFFDNLVHGDMHPGQSKSMSMSQFSHIFHQYTSPHSVSHHHTSPNLITLLSYALFCYTILQVIFLFSSILKVTPA